MMGLMVMMLMRSFGPLMEMTCLHWHLVVSLLSFFRDRKYVNVSVNVIVMLCSLCYDIQLMKIEML